VLAEDLRLESTVLPNTPCNWDKACRVRERMVGQTLGQKEVERVRKAALLRAAVQSWGILIWISWSPVDRCPVLCWSGLCPSPPTQEMFCDYCCNKQKLFGLKVN